MPRNITARPTTDFARENIFNVLENMEDFEGKKALDLFSGTGAIAFEFLSRGCASVTAVETASTQANFIRSVAEKLHDTNLKVVKGDAFRFCATCREKFDFIFADPPYNHPDFGKVAGMILGSQMLKPGTVVVVEHSKAYDFSDLPHFREHRAYGSVNFSIFVIGDTRDEDSVEETDDNTAGEDGE